MTATKSSIILNETQTFIIENYSFGNLPKEELNEIYKDGREFAHIIEQWIPIQPQYSSLTRVKGCKEYDFIDDENIKYDEKTFTCNGCRFSPSNMQGAGRTFDKEVFEKKAKNLIYCIVSNINFPEIKIKFVKGSELIKTYPKGKIPLNHHDKFFN